MNRQTRTIKQARFIPRPDQIQDTQRLLAQHPELQLNPSRLDEGRLAVLKLLKQAVDSGQISDIRPHSGDSIIEGLYDYTVGLGPLEGLIGDSQIEQINVLTPKTVLVQIKGEWHEVPPESPHLFRDEAHLRQVGENLARRAGKELSPLTDPILDFGFESPILRININMLRLGGLTITLRRGRVTGFSTQQLIRWGDFDEPVANLLADAAKRLIGCAIIGTVGSGKTVLLEEYINQMPPRPIAVADDAYDCHPAHPYTALLHLPASGYTRHSQPLLTLSDLIRGALRVGDVLVVAEVRGTEEARVLVQNAASMTAVCTTLHGNTSEDGLMRLASLAQPPAQQASADSGHMVREAISSAFPLIIQMSKRGTRRFVSGVSHLIGWEENGRPRLRPLVTTHYQQGEIQWRILDEDLDPLKPILPIEQADLLALRPYADVSPDSLYEKGQALIEQGDWAGAMKVYGEMVRVWPEVADGRSALIQCLEQTGQREAIETKADDVLRLLIDLQAQQAWEQIGQVMERLQRNPAVHAVVCMREAQYPRWQLVVREGQAEMVLARKQVAMVQGLLDVAESDSRLLDRALHELDKAQLTLLPKALRDEVYQVRRALLERLVQTAVDTDIAHYQAQLERM